jgi:hypothetical protein
LAVLHQVKDRAEVNRLVLGKGESAGLDFLAVPTLNEINLRVNVVGTRDENLGVETIFAGLVQSVRSVVPVRLDSLFHVLSFV